MKMEKALMDTEKAMWAFGTLLYFVGIGMWFIVCAYLIGWAIFLVIPTLIIGWFIGWVSRSFTRRTERWPAFRSFWLWEWMRTSYFEYTVHGPGKSLVEHETTPPQDTAAGSGGHERLMWAIYPHGVMSCTGLFFWGLNPAFKNIVPCIHSGVFLLPLVREMAGWMGCTSVTEKDITAAIEETGRVILAPGGIADIANEGNEVKKRHGFLRLAKKTGASVVPIWIPEERSHYSMWLPLGRSLQALLGYPVPILMWGKTLLPFLPKRVKTRIFVGEAICLKDKSVEEGFDAYYRAIEILQEQADKKE